MAGITRRMVCPSGWQAVEDDTRTVRPIRNSLRRAARAAWRKPPATAGIARCRAVVGDIDRRCIRLAPRMQAAHPGFYRRDFPGAVRTEGTLACPATTPSPYASSW